ncbi:hypothetical protein OOOCML_33325 (plasmid) [Cupriavidus necator H16]|uniref:Transposase n=1 Tax=Cupriavidus necator (strain ATCC 17699 / DSM 428 / KCTC 22496 / NCIMB 10442 / H16 / Stanier 337) TaxID=381666 RepID=A0AAE5ZMY0_CUPNH|nr:hypothetical protein E6A55_33225 [Cupriavidus necator H16]
MLAPQFVKPYVKTKRNDAADAEAICEAVARPNMSLFAAGPQQEFTHGQRIFERNLGLLTCAS